MRFETRTAIAIALLGASSFSLAGTNYQDEYEKKIKASQDVGVLGNDLAGDRVNFYTGATSFSATDISLPGNSLALALSRSYEVGYDNNLAASPGPDRYTPEIETMRVHAFGDWDLDVPHISTVMTQSGGWVVDSTTPTKRCSVVGQVTSTGVAANGAPPYVGGSWTFHADAYWSGYSLHTPGGEQTLLLASLPNAERPSTDGPFHWTTNQDWWISCLPTIANGVGEGYVARSPDGSKYTFNWLSKRNVTSIMDRSEHDPGGYGTFFKHFVFRAEYLMLPTRVEDRFGNWIAYEWSNDEFARLTRMSSGPVGSTIAEQSITLSYQDGLVSSATDGIRTWRYEYLAGRLIKVTLPDSTFWQYDLLNIGFDIPPTPYCDTEISINSPDYYWICFGNGEIGWYFNDALVVHPSGARIDFTFDNHYQYSPSSNGSYPMGIASKTISGAGLATANWKFSFLPSKPEIKAACQAGACPTRIMTDQVNPDGSLSRRIFGVTPTVDESVLLGELEGSLAANGGGSPAITTSAHWGADILDDIAPASGSVPVFYKEMDYRMAPAGQATAYTVRVGANPMLSNMFPQIQVYASERRLPVVTRNLVQQGVTFTSETTAFDKFARPVQASRRSVGSASGNFSRSETTTYSDNTAKWVMGQVATTTDGATGKVVSQTDYDPTTALPVRSYSYGLLQQTLGYNADGTLASVRDGLGNVTALSNWSHGVPQLISYPTSVSESATVDGLGNLLSTTDQLASTTTYGYDVMGRLSRITYPVGDTAAWSDTTRGFVFVAAAEYGLPAGHWRQTVRTGNGQASTFYDARWHPVLVITEDTALASSRSFVVKRYDIMGREVFSSYPVGSLVGVRDALQGMSTQYDALGRPVRVSQDSELGILTTNTEYLTGFLTQVTNPRGFKTTTSYQVFDSPSVDAPVRINAEEGVSTVITRDGFGKPLQITRSGPGG